MNRLILYSMLLLSAFSFLTCKITDRKPVEVPTGFDWQGHRGCRGLFPENSLPAFLHALEYPGVQTLELDLAVSKDRQLIVSHEPWFNPAICRDPQGNMIEAKDEKKHLIFEKTAEEIKTYDCGSWGNTRFPDQTLVKTHKPTLREVVEAVDRLYPEKRIRWNLEIKSNPEWDGKFSPTISEFVVLVQKEISALQLSDRVCVQSFDPRPLQLLHHQAPGLTLALLVENTDGFEKNLERLGFTPSIYSPYYWLVSFDLVEKCKKKGMKLIPWTVNEVTAMRRLVRLGVDGIITDYPNLIEQVGKK